MWLRIFSLLHRPTFCAVYAIIISFETSWCYCSMLLPSLLPCFLNKLVCLYFSLSGLLTLSLSISQHSFNKGQRLHNEPESTPLSQTDSGQGSPAGNPSDPRTLPEPSLTLPRALTPSISGIRKPSVVMIPFKDWCTEDIPILPVQTQWSPLKTGLLKTYLFCLYRHNDPL